MKLVIIYILALLTLILSCVPCADSGEEFAYVNDEHTQEYFTKDIDNNIPFDLCSPFCPCGCCGVSIAYVPSFQFEPLLLIDSPIILNSTAQASLVDSFLFDLLDPPKHFFLS